MTLKHCDGFCHTSTLVSHRYTCVQHILKPTPHPSPPYSSGFFRITGFGCPASCICTPEGWFSCKKYSLFYVSHMKIWVQSFVHEIQNLHFTFENLVVCFWSWYMAYGMSHIWMSVHTFSYMHMELCTSHIGQFEHTFSCWIMEFYFHKWISQLNFLTRDMQFSTVQIWNSRSKYSFQKYKMCIFHKWKSR